MISVDAAFVWMKFMLFNFIRCDVCHKVRDLFSQGLLSILLAFVHECTYCFTDMCAKW